MGGEVEMCFNVLVTWVHAYANDIIAFFTIILAIATTTLAIATWIYAKQVADQAKIMEMTLNYQIFQKVGPTEYQRLWEMLEHPAKYFGNTRKGQIVKADEADMFISSNPHDKIL